MSKILPRCDKCEYCYRDKSKNYIVGMTHYCKLNNRDVGQSHFGHNSPRCCPLRERSEKLSYNIKNSTINIEKLKDAIKIAKNTSRPKYIVMSSKTIVEIANEFKNNGIVWEGNFSKIEDIPIACAYDLDFGMIDIVC